MAAAISAGDLALAMSRANNSARMAGSDMNKFIGYVTTVADVTQKSAESVGESFKTIYSRFGNVKANKFSASAVDQASSSYAEDEYESLNDIETVLTSVGIKLRENAGTWRDIDEVMEEIAQKWKTWDTTTKNAVATVVAGTRQRENVITLFENWEDVAKYAEIAENAYGTATEKMEAYTESIEASRQRLTNAIETFALDLNGSGLLKTFYDQITYIIENLGKFGATIATVLLLTKGPSFLGTIGGGLTTIATKIPVYASTKSEGINLKENWTQLRTDYKGYFRGIRSNVASNVASRYNNFKSNLDSKFDETRIVRQQAAYGAALDKATISLNQEEKMRYRNFQAELLSLGATERNTLATELQNGQINASIFSAESKLSADTKAIIAQQLLTELIKAQADQKKISILKDAIANKNFDELNENFFVGLPQTSNKYLRLIGKNLGGSVDPYTTGMAGVARGFGAMAGNLFGMTASNYLLESAPSWAQIVGSTVGSAIASSGATSLATIVTNKFLGKGLLAGVGGLGILSIGLTIAGIIATAIKKSEDNKKKKAEEAFKTAEESYSSAKGMSSTAAKFDELAKGVDKFGKNVSLSDEDYAQFLDYSNELCEVFPELISYTDAEGNMIAKIGTEAKSATEAVKELTKERQNATDIAMLNSVLFNEAADSAYKDYKEGYNKVAEAEKKLDTSKKFYGTPLAFDDVVAETMDGYLQQLTEATFYGSEDITKIKNAAGESIHAILSTYLDNMGYGVNVETAIANGINLLSESTRNQYYEQMVDASDIGKLHNDITIGKKQMAAAQS